MKRPTWATVVGILGIIIGCFGILRAGYDIITPKVIEFQKEIIPEMLKEFEKKQESSKTPLPAHHDKFLNMANKMLNVPNWFNIWLVVSGIIGLLVSGFYIFASISLLLVKKSAIKLFYIMVGISIGFIILKGIVAMVGMPLVGFSMLVGGIFGIGLNVILLVVVITGDKQVFS